MLVDKKELLKRLSESGIEHRVFEHPPVFTVEEAQSYTGHLPGAHVKNLVLKDKSGQVWLITCLDRQTIKVNALARDLGAPRMSFAKLDVLREKLGVEPGSVTPMALVNDPGGTIHFVLDRQIFDYECVNVHPMLNDATVSMAPHDLLAFLKPYGVEPRLYDLAATPQGA